MRETQTFVATGGSGSSRIASVAAPVITANSITLSWTAIASATRFKIFYTTDGVVFSPVAPPNGYRMGDPPVASAARMHGRQQTNG